MRRSRLAPHRQRLVREPALVVLARMLRMREGCQQAADLGGGHGDEVAYVVAAMVIMPQACPGKLSTAAGAPFELRRPEGRQARAWREWRAGTRRRSGGPVVVQAGLVLGGLEAFLDGLITNGKFCCVRRVQLSLTWWHRPLRLRGSALHTDVALVGEPDDPDLDRLPSVQPAPGR